MFKMFFQKLFSFFKKKEEWTSVPETMGMKLARSVQENCPDLPCEEIVITYSKEEMKQNWSDFIDFLEEKDRWEKAANKNNRTYDACA